MKVYYSKGKHVVIFFPATEMKQAHGVLKALAKHFGAKFLRDAVEEMEKDLTAKLPYFPHIHICTNCFCEINTRTDSYVFVDDSYIHVSCPPLKEGRPI